MTRVLVAGVGMTDFYKPGKSPDYTELGRDAALAAITDAGIGYRDIEHVYAGYVFGDSVAGQRAIYPLGLTGVPIFNVTNACATVRPRSFWRGRRSFRARRNARWRLDSIRWHRGRS